MIGNNKEDRLVKFLRQLRWPDLKYNKKSVWIIYRGLKYPILSKITGGYKINFYWFDPFNHEYNLRNDLSSIKFNKSFPIEKFITIKEREYYIPFTSIIKRILNHPEVSNSIFIGQECPIALKKGVLHINESDFKEIFNEALMIFKKSKSYKGMFQRYLTKLATEKYTEKKIENKTLIAKGDLNFTIQRLNLSTKRKKRDFNNYLNKSDISSAGQLTTSLIKNGVFPPEFLRKLSDYFIRENLQDIITLGREILKLRSSNMDSDAAIGISKKVNGTAINQLETLWQKYFEKYFLYLIFSYKEIFPKVELRDINDDKKYPDFIGINHYNGVDAIEIKTHLKNALVWDKSHKNFAFSPELSKAIIQTVNYLDAIVHTRFIKDEDKEKITQTSHPENLNRPRGIIIISSYDKLVNVNNEVEKEIIVRDFTKLRNSVHNIEILTFDEILDIADYYIQKIASK